MYKPPSKGGVIYSFVKNACFIRPRSKDLCPKWLRYCAKGGGSWFAFWLVCRWHPESGKLDFGAAQSVTTVLLPEWRYCFAKLYTSPEVTRCAVRSTQYRTVRSTVR